MGNPRGKINGKRLGVRGLVAAALLREGYSLSRTSKLAGISESSATQLRKQNIYDVTQVDAIRRTIRDEFAITGGRCLKAVSDEKLNKAGVAELVRSAAIAVDRAGILPPSAKEQYFTSMSAYLKKKTETT